tara:strand:- start:487 stop:714 length:228 start_codon:yes stop_codon:yes gene_type:complete
MLADVICVNDWTALTILVRSENNAFLQHSVRSDVVVIKSLVRLSLPLDRGKSILDAWPGSLFLYGMTYKRTKKKH